MKNDTPRTQKKNEKAKNVAYTFIDGKLRLAYINWERIKLKYLPEDNEKIDKEKKI